MTAKRNTDHCGFTLLIAGIIMVVSFSLGVLIGAGTVWKNFKRDQNWIRRKIIRLEDERERVDDLIRSLQDMMDEIHKIEGR